ALPILMALFVSKSNIPFADAERRTEQETRDYSPFRKVRRKAYLKTRAHIIDALVQAVAMVGLFHTYRRTLRWAWKLFRGKIEYSTRGPISQIPMRSVGGGTASHALPDTPVHRLPQVTVELPVLQDDQHCGKAA
ncbi:MAG: hypothetical protein AB7O62_16810, partial [Pirellulales bacterium]